MLKSMTACGRAVQDSEEAHFAVEVQSVNRKHLEIQVFLPRTVGFLEIEIRKKVQESILRGQVTVKIQASFKTKSPYKVEPNIPLAVQVKEAWDKLQQALNVTSEEGGFSLQMLSTLPDILSFENNTEASDEWGLWVALKESLAQFHEMRSFEGGVIAKDLLNRIIKIEKELSLIEKHEGAVIERYRNKLRERLNELLASAESDERVLREVALLAEKVDITEERVRLISHLQQFKDSVQKGVPGKVLEFLIQEMGREINTIGSKSQDILITRAVIAVKAELEKMREQLQNVE